MKTEKIFIILFDEVYKDSKNIICDKMLVNLAISYHKILWEINIMEKKVNLTKLVCLYFFC